MQAQTFSFTESSLEQKRYSFTILKRVEGTSKVLWQLVRTYTINSSLKKIKVGEVPQIPISYYYL